MGNPAPMMIENPPKAPLDTSPARDGERFRKLVEAVLKERHADEVLTSDKNALYDTLDTAESLDDVRAAIDEHLPADDSVPLTNERTPEELQVHRVETVFLLARDILTRTLQGLDDSKAIGELLGLYDTLGATEALKNLEARGA